jgi:hypothetical protein
LLQSRPLVRVAAMKHPPIQQKEIAALRSQ